MNLIKAVIGKILQPVNVNELTEISGREIVMNRDFARFN
jgi:hypothetical protein